MKMSKRVFLCAQKKRKKKIWEMKSLFFLLICLHNKRL